VSLKTDTKTFDLLGQLTGVKTPKQISSSPNLHKIEPTALKMTEQRAQSSSNTTPALGHRASTPNEGRGEVDQPSLFQRVGTFFLSIGQCLGLVESTLDIPGVPENYRPVSVPRLDSHGRCSGAKSQHGDYNRCPAILTGKCRFSPQLYSDAPQPLNSNPV
jgi:hypothetical protein